MHHKTFGGRAPPGTAGGAYTTPDDPWLDLRGNDGDKRRGKQKDRRGGTEEKEATRKGEEDVRGGREGRHGREGRKGEGEGGGGKSRPTVISKSRRLCTQL